MTGGHPVQRSRAADAAPRAASRAAAARTRGKDPMSRREFDFAALEETHARGRAPKYRRDPIASGASTKRSANSLPRQTGIWQLGRTYTLLGPTRKFHDLDLRVRRIEKHPGLEPEGD